MLAWDHTGPASERDDLLGFAVHRFDLTANRDAWLQGQKRFAGQENLGPNLTSDIAPFQRFRWGDYGAYPQLPHAQNKFSWFTTPAWLPNYDGRPWDAKPLGQHKIHTKSIVSDPFSQSPRLLVGSANFSDESVNKNDENAFLVEGDQRASAIVATEFLRMFDHYRTRKFIASLQKSPDDQYLVDAVLPVLPAQVPRATGLRRQLNGVTRSAGRRRHVATRRLSR